MGKILFFNGWGMDENAVPPMTEGIILNYPYTLPEGIDLHSGEWTAVGWSFGAYYLSKFIAEHPELKFKQVIAVNGHGAMLGKYGIRAKMLQLTLTTLTPASLKDFYKNMALPAGRENTARDFDSIKAELEDFALNYSEQPNPFTAAFVSQGDRIVPAKAMTKYFQEQGVPVTAVEGPHYPFGELSSWAKILEGGASR